VIDIEAISSSRSFDAETLPPYQKDEFPPQYQNAIEQPPEFVQAPIPAVVNNSESGSVVRPKDTSSVSSQQDSQVQDSHLNQAEPQLPESTANH
jgi:hypothetical protein